MVPCQSDLQGPTIKFHLECKLSVRTLHICWHLKVGNFIKFTYYLYWAEGANKENYVTLKIKSLKIKMLYLKTRKFRSLCFHGKFHYLELPSVCWEPSCAINKLYEPEQFPLPPWDSFSSLENMAHRVVVWIQNLISLNSRVLGISRL